MEKDIKIKIGEESRYFQVGNFLNAVDELVYYFTGQSSCDPDDFYRALEFYSSIRKD